MISASVCSCRWHRVTVCLAVLMLLLSGCYRRLCPAYASAFILDDSIRMVIFSPFGEDSMPLPPPRVKKDKNGLIARVSDRKRASRMRIILARKVYPPPPPPEEEVTAEETPLSGDEAALDSLGLPIEPPAAAEDLPPANTTTPPVADLPPEDEADEGEKDYAAAATLIDSATAPQYLYGYDPKDNFNVEQEFYNRHFGQLLLAQEGEVTQDTSATEESEFEDIPGAYVEGSFIETEEEDVYEETSKPPKKKRKKKRTKKKDTTKEPPPEGVPLPEEETVPKDEG